MENEKNSKSISRREFLKLLKVGGATTLALSGCGRMSRYVTRRPYADMPEYQLPGESVHYATACQECPAGCGLIVRTVEGRAIKVEGNEDHPVNWGGTCSRGQASVQGLYDPDRFQGPVQQSRRGSGQFQAMNWDQAVETIAGMLGDMDPQEGVFYVGLTQDHMYDFFYEISQVLGSRPPYRFGALGLFEARSTLIRAARQLFGKEQIPYFALGESDVILSFGANFTETWLSPVAYSHEYGRMRQGHPTERGLLFHFESRMSQTAANADQWIPVKPGTEGIVALGLSKIVARENGSEEPPYVASTELDQVASISGVSLETLEKIGRFFADASRKVAIPGGHALSTTNGFENALSILALNTLAAGGTKEHGLFFVPEASVHEKAKGRQNSFEELENLIASMNNGEVESLFIYGADPIFELPEGLGFKQALDNVSSVISFSPFKDDTALYADYVFPDHTPLESWGYQKRITASDRKVISGSQPVVGPLHNTQSTLDLFLAAVADVGGKLRDGIPYQDEVEFLQQSVKGLMGENGFYKDEVIEGFWSKFLQFGGWWVEDSGLEKAELYQPLSGDFLVSQAEGESGDEYDFHLHLYPATSLGDGRGANRPWLQETPDAMTTVMWNTWVEVNPETARNMGLENGDVLEIESPQGKIEAALYIYPGIRPDTIAIPYGQGHQALGRYAGGRGANPMTLVNPIKNSAGDLAYGSTRVRIRPTGEKRELSRYESQEGVYGRQE